MLMYSHSYNIPNSNLYRTENSFTTYENYPYANNDERFLLAPFLFGGLAGTALGYGIANNNQINNGGCCMPYYQTYYQPIYQVPYGVSTNNYYY